MKIITLIIYKYLKMFESPLIQVICCLDIQMLSRGMHLYARPPGLSDYVPPLINNGGSG